MTTPEALLKSIIDTYASIEQRLAARIAADAVQDVASPTWAADKLAAAAQTRRWAQTVLGRTTGPMRERVLQAVLLNFMRGGSKALEGLAELSDTAADWIVQAGVAPGPAIMKMVTDKRLTFGAKLAEIERAIPGGAGINRLVLSLAGRIEGTHAQILRWADDAYRSVIAVDVAPTVLSGAETRAEAMRTAWAKFSERGITGFVDRSGRRWSLTSYIEMASRTTVAAASTAGRVDRLRGSGIRYVIVVDHAHECPKCRPWEGKVLALSGPDGARDVLMSDETGRRPPATVRVAGTLSEATREGLFHPNCEHSVGAYVHGVTRIPTGTADSVGYNATVRQRELERQIRRAKSAVAATTTPTGRRKAQDALRARQAELKQHIADNASVGLMRRPQRERPGIGISPSAGAR